MFAKLASLTRNAIKKSFFDGDFESTISLHTHEESSQEIVFVIVCVYVPLCWQALTSSTILG